MEFLLRTLILRARSRTLAFLRILKSLLPFPRVLHWAKIAGTCAPGFVCPLWYYITFWAGSISWSLFEVPFGCPCFRFPLESGFICIHDRWLIDMLFIFLWLFIYLITLWRPQLCCIMLTRFAPWPRTLQAHYGCIMMVSSAFVDSMTCSCIGIMCILSCIFNFFCALQHLCVRIWHLLPVFSLVWLHWTKGCPQLTRDPSSDRDIVCILMSTVLVAALLNVLRWFTRALCVTPRITKQYSATCTNWENHLHKGCTDQVQHLAPVEFSQIVTPVCPDCLQLFLGSLPAADVLAHGLCIASVFCIYPLGCMVYPRIMNPL